ncbi:hypothetical protein IAU60_001572 [Kwoniella sp. DSM 27419]
MAVPPPQAYPNENGHGEVFLDHAQPIAGPSNYARQENGHHPMPMPTQPIYGVNGYHQPYPMDQVPMAPQQFMAQYPAGMPLMPHGQPLYPGFDNMAPTSVMPNFHFGSMPPGPWQEEWADDQMHDGQEMIYSNLEVKHRRRTTPDQLKILEYWYDINPKPDNALREHLAGQLGMTKRNVQVWFQNRRAKMKGLAKKEEKANGDGKKTPEDQSTQPSLSSGGAPNQVPVPTQLPTPASPPKRQMMLSPMGPPMGPPNMTRRASLANGEAAKIEMFVAKRAAAASGQTLRPPGFVSPQRSPLMGTASAARRTSIPYPTPVSAGPGSGNPLSPKVSPVVRVMPSALHLTALRNNTRRASMPGAAQLISSGPFTPPRVVSSQHQVGKNRGARELSPIKDHDLEGNQLFLDGDDMNATFVTPPSSIYNTSNLSPISFLATDSTGYDPSLFSPASPLPNPAFSFGGDLSAHAPVLDEAEAARQQQLFLAFQQRGRMGSIASINTYTTDNGNGTDQEEGNIPEWSLSGQEAPDGFDPDTRRASAPADLLHQINLMGINTNVNPAPLRPSPLGANFTADSYPIGNYDPNAYLTHEMPHSAASSSLSSSEGPSPTHGQAQNQNQPQYATHLSAPMMQQHSHSHSLSLSPGHAGVMQRSDSSSVSPYSDHSPSNLAIGAQHSAQTYGQQAYQNAMFDGYQPPVGGIAHPSVLAQQQAQAQAHGHNAGQGQQLHAHPLPRQLSNESSHSQYDYNVHAAQVAPAAQHLGQGQEQNKEEFDFLTDFATGGQADVLV